MASAPLDPHDVADRVLRPRFICCAGFRRTEEESGLTQPRLSALSVLVLDGPTTLGALAHAEQVSAPTMSRLVTAFERRVPERRRDPPAGTRPHR